MKRLSRRSSRWLVAAATAAPLVLIVASAFARPGGGSSYSGGSSSRGGGGGYSGGGSSGGGDGAGAILELILLCIEHPIIGIPLVIIIILYFYFKSRSASGQRDWSSGISNEPAVRTFEPYVPPPRKAEKFNAIRGLDPQFSRVVFDDFFYSLYAEIHRTRGLNQLNLLSAYLSPNAATALQQATRGPVSDVVIGAVRYTEVSASAASGCRIIAEVESNYTEAGQGNYVRERWTLARGPNAKSRTPERTRQLGCPNCGAPQDSLFSGTCKHCQRVVNDGSFDWVVQSVSVMQREHRPPILTANVAEEGTDLATIRDSELPESVAVIRAKDPAFDVSQLNARVALIFQQFQIGWSGRDLTKMRPFLSDALFTVQQYWIEAYQKQHLRNMTDGARITNIELAKAVSDAYYDALTVRLYATSLDYTISDDGKLMSGGRSIQRSYSEYWTLIRGTNRKGPTRTDLACSNCGAPLDINMVGVCKFCKVKVTSGDFDWVLSRIEQDESYTG